jgi:hypothetical protein
VPLAGSGPKSSETIKVNPDDVAVLATQSSQQENSTMEVAWGIATANAPWIVFSLLDEGTSSTSITAVAGLPATPAATSFHFSGYGGWPYEF